MDYWLGGALDPVLEPSNLLLEDEMGGARWMRRPSFPVCWVGERTFCLLPEMSLPCGIWHARFGGG